MSEPEVTPASLMRDFLEESVPIADRVAGALLELERRLGAGDLNTDLLRSMRSDLHTLTGNAGLVGLHPLQALARSLDDALAMLADRLELRTSAVAKVLVEGGDLLARMTRSAPDCALAPAQRYTQRISELMANREAPEPAAPSLPASLQSSAGPRSEATAETPAATRNSTMSRSSDTLRVDAGKLDRLVELAGELIAYQAAHCDDFQKLMREQPGSELIEAMAAGANAMARNLDALQQQLLAARLIPISVLFARFPRLVRDLSLALKKKIRLAREGEATEIDKSVIDGIGEALVHLVRNAVDHGIEPPSERLAAGKSAEGSVTLAASIAGDVVRVAVSDDGRGIDPQAIETRAKALGIATDGMTPERLQELIFHPGFSTAMEVTELSGRGVGMDVVADSIRRIGGSIEVRSRPGAGTTFILDLPLTLTVARVLLYQAVGSTYAVPVQHVLEGFELDRERIAEIHQKGVVLWRGKALAIHEAPELGAFRPKASCHRKECVVLVSGRRLRALAVDRLLQQQSVVWKQLDPVLGHPFGYSGATILGSGRVALVLDVPRLLAGTEVGA